MSKLLDTDATLSAGGTIADAAKRIDMTETPLHRRRDAFGGIKAQDLKRRKKLERGNQRLKRVVAECRGR